MKKIFLLFILILVLSSYGVNKGILALNLETSKNFFSSLFRSASSGKTVQVVDEESVITRAVEKALPSVVTVVISKDQRLRDTLNFSPFGGFEVQPGGSKHVEQNIGSGFIVGSDGVIITNKHVVSDTEAEYKVIMNNDKTYTAREVFRDSLNDLAIVKIDAQNLKPLELGKSDHLKLGQTVIAIGTPLGEFRNTVTQGIISGLGRGITAGSPFEGAVERLDNVIQTDAAINPGNSGGPLLNSLAQVIGINTAVSQEGQNIGFAIPSNVIAELLDNYRSSGGKISRAFLGVRYKIIDTETAIRNDLVSGAYVLEVVTGSSAEIAGLQKGDVITKIEGKKVTKEDDISKVVRKKKVGEGLSIEFWREGIKQSKTITLGEYK